MGRKFHEASGQPCPFDPDGLAEFVSGMIDSPQAAIFLTEAGMIGGVLAPAYCSPGWSMAVELFWWSEDRQGLRLLRAFEEWAHESGAQEVRMTTLHSLPSAARILSRRGYGATEISYSKVI